MFAESPCLLNKPLQLNHPPGGGAINPAFGIGLRREHAEDLFLAHDQVFLALELDLLPGVLAEEDLVPSLDVERRDLAVLVGLALADRDHFALLGLFLGAVGTMIAPTFCSPSSMRFTITRSASGRIPTAVCVAI